MDPNQPQQYQQNSYPQTTSGAVASPVSYSSDHRRNIMIIAGLGVLSIVLLGVSIWLFSMYSQQKNNVDEIAQQRVDAALEQQSEKLNQEFTAQQESNTTRYSGPSIYGSISFAYPKLWSVYNNPDPDNSALYEVKVHPEAVGRGVSGEAIIVQVIDKSYDEKLSEFDSGIENGSIDVSAVNSNGQKGVRLTGAVGDDQGQSGVTVLLPLRDRTISFTNLSETHQKAYNNSFDSLKFQP